MRFVIALALCCAASAAFGQPNAVVAQASAQDLCYWAGVPYSTGARLRTTDAEQDPHVVYHYFICRDGGWTQQ
jgi:hypothetical protein